MNRNVFQQALILCMAQVDPDEDAISDILTAAGIDRDVYAKTVAGLADEILHEINAPRVPVDLGMEMRDRTASTSFSSVSRR